MAVSAGGEHLDAAGSSRDVIGFDLNLSARNSSRPANLRPNYLKEMRPRLPLVALARITLTGISQDRTLRSFMEESIQVCLQYRVG